MEEWKDIIGYEGRYQVSDLGNVKSLNYSRKGVAQLLKPILKSTGYYVVTLNVNGRQKQFHVHRLVADAFVNKKYGCSVVDHINTIKTDNRAENLRWGTISDNVNNPISADRRTKSIRKLLKGKYGVASLKHRACVQKDLDGNIVKIWSCMYDAVRALGVDSGGLTRVCQGKQHTAKGYKWEYYNAV